MVATSSGPVRRNFVANGPTSQRKSGGVARTLFLSLAALVIALFALALHISKQVVMQSSSTSSIHHHGAHSSSGGMDDAPPVKAVASSEVSHSIIDRARANSPKADAKYAKDRVYCMIPFIWNEEIYDAIMDTWGKRCDVINFLTDSIVGAQLKGDKIIADHDTTYKPYWEYPKGTFPDNVIFINMTRTWNDCPVDKKGDHKVCRHIWEKMWRSWVYVEENHLDQAEWFCKVDYDTYFFPDNVKYFVRHQHDWDPFTEHHYFGHLIKHRRSAQGRDNMIVGAAACWSHKTLDAIADVYREMPKGSTKGERGKCEDRAQATEEASTSLCLKQHLNISAEPARDDECREHITVSNYKDVLTWNRTEQGEWWYWRGKPEEAGQMENAISRRPIGLHRYKTADKIRELEQHFFGPPNNKEIKKLNARTKNYVMEVRATMGTDN